MSRKLIPGILAVAALAWAPPAGATIAPTLHDDPACDTLTPHPGSSYVFCDDGKPDNSPAPGPGGLIPNLTNDSAVTVPAKYGGDGYTGLPAKAGDAASMPGANPGTGDISLDVDVTLPTTAPPAGGYPLIVMMHGCCGGNRTGWEATSFDDPDPADLDAFAERWHYNNAWFASRGYVVITYTARGFVDSQERGSTGETQLDSRRFEINDYQHLACQVLANASSFEDVVPGPDPVTIDPDGVVVTGGSYGGGFSWLAATDPKWTCNAETGASGTPMQLAAAAPKYGWTDLAYTLVPTGTHSESPLQLPAINGCDDGPKQLDGTDCPVPRTPVGTPKTSIVAGLYATGNLPSGNHTTFPAPLHEAFVCLNGAYPAENDPACANTINTILPEFMRDRSAYYQNDFFANIASDPSYRVPIFNAATFTDPLFPAYEDRRMANRLLATVPGYPIQIYHGDYQHFTRNKAKEWGDLCGADHHVCTVSDYPNGGASPSDFNSDPATLQRTGITTRLNRFIDHYADPSANASEPQPAFDVTATLEVCPQNSPDLGIPEDEPGPTFNAPTFEQLAPNTLEVNMPGASSTISDAEPNSHALDADPVQNQLNNGNGCVVETTPAGQGVASYLSDPIPSDQTMIGSTRVLIGFTFAGDANQGGLQLNARLYDVFPNGDAVLVDRGTRRVSSAEAATGQLTYELHGNGWRFAAGHRIRIEIAQDDHPYVQFSTVPSSTTLDGVTLLVPVREGGSIGGGPENPPGAGSAAGPCATQAQGTKKDDHLEGTESGDTIKGRRGDDRIRGNGGDDCVKGNSGEDRVKGNDGEDKVSGGTGEDTLSGGDGEDTIKARGGGRDKVRCGKGEDTAVVDPRDKVHGCEHVHGGGKGHE
ncbi:MAG TPA: CocE/NonD family hydrolase [Solirubrobacterales bacterium]|nr:CocE/NonD family hydrolase [Solirubrobacterales bacterium]